MNILLIQPPKSPMVIGGEDVHIYEPLDLEYIAAGVSDYHEVKILDMRLEKNLQANLNEFKPDVVGITACTTHVNTVKQLFSKIKAWNPEILTVVGGHHAIACPQDFQVEDIDVIVVGEGVFTFQEIIAKFEKGKKYLFDMLDNPDLKKKKIFEAREIHVDLDAYPLPRRDLTKKYRNNYFSEWMKPLASMVTSKGCTNKCNFCCLWKQTGGKYLKRRPENIVKELETISEEYIFFADAESMLDAERMEYLAHLIKKRGIKKKYYLYSRSDTVVKYPKLFEIWADIGLVRVFIGFEFFRNEELDNVNKGLTIKDNENAMKILKECNIDMIASFLVRPEYTQEDFKAFGNYCRELKSRLELDSAVFTFTVLTPLPGTDFYQQVESQLITKNCDYFDLYHTVLPTKLPLKQFYEELFNLYMKIYKPKDMISLFKKYRLKDVPENMLRIKNMNQKMKNAYKDY